MWEAEVPVSPERLLLSSVMKSSDMKLALAHGVTAEMFHTHQEEWVWLDTYYRKYKKLPSRATFSAKFPEFRLANTADTPYLVEEVKKAHAQTVLIERISEVADLVTEGDIEAAVRIMNASIVDVAAGIGTQGDEDIFTSFKDVLDDVESRVKRVKDTGAAGIPTGFAPLDELIGGLNPGDICVIAARLGQGKSWSMQYMASHAAAHGYNVIFDALEQTRSQVAMRIHSLLSSGVTKEVFNSSNLMRGKDFNLVEYRRFLRELKTKMTGRMHVSDASRGRVSSFTVASQIERHDPDIVFIDYIALMQRQAQDWQGVAQLSGDLTSLAANYRIPIVYAAQLNRENGLGKEPPGPEALALSDAIGQDADLVITQRQMSKHILAMRLAKNRNGEGDLRWWVEFRPGEGVMKSVSYNRAMDVVDQDRDAVSAKEDAA
jgi:replicative DNA helicase